MSERSAASCAIMQPYFFPYLGYFQLISAVDRFVLYDDLIYIKRGWVSRNRIQLVKGGPVYVIVSLDHKSSHTKIRDVRVSERPWRRTLLKSIWMNYRRSPYFEEVFSIVEDVIETKTPWLSEINRKGIRRIVEFLGVETELVETGPFGDLEERLAQPVSEWSAVLPELQLEVPEVKVARAVEICRSLGAGRFINPAAGAAMYPGAEFRRNGIDVGFLTMDEVVYEQVCSAAPSSTSFEPRLSIIDVLMNCGREPTRELLDRYTLVEG